MVRLSSIAVCMGFLWLGSFTILMIPLAIRVAADEREMARSLLEQLDDRRFTERKAAFLKLCDPRWEIDAWLDEQTNASDPNRAALVQWIRRLRRIQGPIEDRLEMMADYQSLSEGDLAVISKYIDHRKIESLIDMLEQIPESARMEMTRYSSGDNPFDGLISAAWRDGVEREIPRLLNAILPSHPIRVGLNARWKEIGMPPEWKVDIPVGVPEVEIASLEIAGRIDDALATAKRFRMSEEYEKLLMRHRRWDAWMELDPLRKETAATGWGDVQRILLLECLGRHEEALVYYELRKSDRGKNKAFYNQQKALMAMIVGDKPAFEKLLQTEDPNGWVELLFTHSDLARLFETEGLSDLTVQSIDRWFDKWIRQGGAISRPIRFQSLFHRLGLNQLEDTLHRRIHRHIKTSSGEQSLQEWDSLLFEWSRYGLDERRLEVIAELCSRKESQHLGNEWPLNQSGIQPAQVVTPEVTLETIFYKNFTNIRSMAAPLYNTLRNRDPGMDARARVAILEDLHQGRMPVTWNENELVSVIRDMMRLSMRDPSLYESILVDVADLFDTLGWTEKAFHLLQDQADSYTAGLPLAKYASKLGKTDDAIRLSLKLVDQQRDDVAAYLQASQCLADARRLGPWLNLQKRSLSRLDLWKWMEDFQQNQRRRQRAEPPSEVVLMLETLQRNAPSTWQELWFGEAYTFYGSRVLEDWYHRSIGQHPERIEELHQLSLRNAMEEIANRSRTQAGQGQPGATSIKDLDWPLASLQYERVFATSFWRAIQEGDRDAADRYLRFACQIYPEQINTLIDAVPMVRSQFGDETLTTWYECYAAPMRTHLERFPNDTLIANNLAWLAAKCGLELERAHQLAMRVVEQRPTDTYLDTLAEVEFTLGNTKKAIEISERCRSMRPRDPHHVRQLERFRKEVKLPAQPPG